MVITILLANEPRAYREAIALAVRTLRPQTTVVVTDPDDVDEYVLKYSPQVVVCSQITETIDSKVPNWAVIYPNGANGAVLRIGGQHTSVGEIDLEGIIALLID